MVYTQKHTDLCPFHFQLAIFEVWAESYVCFQTKLEAETHVNEKK